MRETGPDTGIFIGYIRTIGGSATIRDGILNTHPHARIDALYTDPWRGDRSLEDMILVGPVDPYGIFFDSRTGLPVDGVRVTIINTATGNPAVVYGDDLIATYPSTIVSGTSATDSSGQVYHFEAGEYRFPFVDLGTYRLEVDAPLGYVAPSLVPDSNLQTLQGGPFALGPGSRVDPFNVTAGPPIEIDVPLDGEGFISVTRSGSSDDLEIGDFIQYTVTVGTNIDADITGNVHDTLPAGLRILAETLLVDGATPSVAPILSPNGRDITFPSIVFPDGDVATITYIAQVTPQSGENTLLTSTSTADAHRLMANTASHDLEITEIFMLDRDIVMGQIYGTGCEANYDPDLNLSGIRVMLENGRFVDSDENGRFTFRNVGRGAHVVALDPLSVPRGFEPILCNNTTQKAGSAVSRFIEARGGFSRQVFFHLAPAKFYDIPSPIAPTLKTSADHDADWFKENPGERGLVFPQDGYLPASRSIDIVGARAKKTPILLPILMVKKFPISTGDPRSTDQMAPVLISGKVSRCSTVPTRYALLRPTPRERLSRTRLPGFSTTTWLSGSRSRRMPPSCRVTGAQGPSSAFVSPMPRVFRFIPEHWSTSVSKRPINSQPLPPRVAGGSRWRQLPPQALSMPTACCACAWRQCASPAPPRSVPSPRMVTQRPGLTSLPRDVPLFWSALPQEHCHINRFPITCKPPGRNRYGRPG